MTSTAAFSRRKALQAIAAITASPACAVAALAGPTSPITAVPSLGAIAAARGILFGTAIDAETLANPLQAELYLHHARIFTSDNAMKFGSLRPEEGPANFEIADQLVAFAVRHGIPLRGHCLIWNDWVPDWVARLSSSRRAYWLDRHIDEVVGRYAGRLHSWDVVNEPFWPASGNPGGFRNGPWYAAMGRGYVLAALKRARAADPNGKIVINEAGPEWETVWGASSKPYRDGLLRLIDEVQDAGVRLDAVGLQCHWFPEFTFDAAQFRAYLAKLAKRDVSIYLTELDVNDVRLPGDDATRDAEVARRYAALIEAALAEPKVEIIQTWQLADSASWLINEPKLWGPGGRRPRPLPFDAALRPKAAYDAIARALASPR